MKQLARGFKTHATAAYVAKLAAAAKNATPTKAPSPTDSTTTTLLPTSRPRRSGRSLFGKSKAPAERIIESDTTPISSPSGIPATSLRRQDLRAPKAVDVKKILASSKLPTARGPLREPRSSLGLSPCGSGPADSFFADVVGEGLTEEQLWTQKGHGRWIMPPDSHGRQDPGTIWPPPVTDAANLKGVHNFAVGIGLNAKAKKAPVHCSDFSALYLDPWTPQGIYRKSRPSMVLQWQPHMAHNGHTDFDTTKYAPYGQPSATGYRMLDSQNPCPLAWSTARTKTSKFYRRVFLEEFHNTPGACDGVYLFRVRKFPESEKYIRSKMRQLVELVAKDWANQRTHFPSLDQSLHLKVRRPYQHQEPYLPKISSLREYDPVMVEGRSRSKTKRSLPPKNKKSQANVWDEIDGEDGWLDYDD